MRLAAGLARQLAPHQLATEAAAEELHGCFHKRIDEFDAHGRYARAGRLLCNSMAPCAWRMSKSAAFKLRGFASHRHFSAIVGLGTLAREGNPPIARKASQRNRMVKVYRGGSR